MKNFYNFFNIEYGQRKYHSKRDLKKNKDGIPLISSKGSNQGIYGYFDIIPKYEKVISLPNTGTICYANYQEKKCCIDDNCLVLKPKINLTIQEIFYFILLLRKQKFRFVYGRQVTANRIGNIKIPDKFPKWIYIKDFKKIITKNSKNNDKLNLTNRNWNFFNIEKDLFEIKGSKTTNKKILKRKEKGFFPYISTKATNNGVDGFYNFSTEKGNVIVVESAVCGFSSYQEKNFSASDHVEKLIPKFKLNIYNGLFITTLLNLEKFRYNYGIKCNQERIKRSKIKLPIDKNGNPDWKFMENYIKSLPFSSSL